MLYGICNASFLNSEISQTLQVILLFIFLFYCIYLFTYLFFILRYIYIFFKKCQEMVKE